VGADSKAILPVKPRGWPLVFDNSKPVLWQAFAAMSWGQTKGGWHFCHPPDAMIIVPA
jgi:hypothetical protein